MPSHRLHAVPQEVEVLNYRQQQVIERARKLPEGVDYEKRCKPKPCLGQYSPLKRQQDDSHTHDSGIHLYSKAGRNSS